MSYRRCLLISGCPRPTPRHATTPAAVYSRGVTCVRMRLCRQMHICQVNPMIRGHNLGSSGQRQIIVGRINITDCAAPP